METPYSIQFYINNLSFMITFLKLIHMSINILNFYYYTKFHSIAMPNLFICQLMDVWSISNFGLMINAAVNDLIKVFTCTYVFIFHG